MRNGIYIYIHIFFSLQQSDGLMPIHILVILHFLRHQTHNTGGSGVGDYVHTFNKFTFNIINSTLHITHKYTYTYKTLMLLKSSVPYMGIGSRTYTPHCGHESVHVRVVRPIRGECSQSIVRLSCKRENLYIKSLFGITRGSAAGGCLSGEIGRRRADGAPPSHGDLVVAVVDGGAVGGLVLRLARF